MEVIYWRMAGTVLRYLDGVILSLLPKDARRMKIDATIAVVCLGQKRIKENLVNYIILFRLWNITVLKQRHVCPSKRDTKHTTHDVWFCGGELSIAVDAERTNVDALCRLGLCGLG